VHLRFSSIVIDFEFKDIAERFLSGVVMALINLSEFDDYLITG